MGLQLHAPCSCPADPEGLALCWDPSRWDALYFQQQLFQFFPVLPASSTSREAEGTVLLPGFFCHSLYQERGELWGWHFSAGCCWIYDCRAVCSPWGPSHLTVLLLALGRACWRKNGWILGNESGGSVSVGLNWCSRGERIGFCILQRVIARGALSWRREVDNLLLLMQRTAVCDSFCQPWISFKRLCDSCSVSAICIAENLIVSPWISCPEYVRVHFAVL